MKGALRAVLFDLFGTLVPNLDPLRFRATVDRIARTLGAPEEAFGRTWHEHFRARMSGSLRAGEGQFEVMLRSLGRTATLDQRRRASLIQQDFLLESLVPRPDALECLRELQGLGLALGLVTDCSSATPPLLDRTPLGPLLPVRAASAELGVTKPDARMYEHVTRALDVRPDTCLYVGDGNSEELPGARALGMTTAWVDNGDAQHWHERFQPGGDHRVESLLEILPIARSLLGGDCSKGLTPGPDE